MRRSLLVLLALCLVQVTGCASFNKAVSKRVYKKGKTKSAGVTLGGTRTYRLSSSDLKDRPFEDQMKLGRVTVQHQQGLGDQAECLAKKIDELIIEVEDRTGLEMTVSPKIYLIRLDEIPQSFNIDIDVNEPNELPVAMFAEAGNEDCHTILAHNRLVPYGLIHELVEVSISSPHGRKAGRVLGELHWNWLVFRGSVRNYTRWFRDGFANYAGLIAHEHMCRDGELAGSAVCDAGQVWVHQHPFSSLGRVGKRLFSWHQRSGHRHNEEYYNAALGLLLLIRERFGQDGIRRIVEEIGNHDFLNGRDLVRITNQALDTDIMELAEEFEFPQMGLQTQSVKKALVLNENLGVENGLFVESVEPNSLADQAGIKMGDVLVEADGRPLSGLLDLELALFDALDRDTVAVSLWRRDEGMVTIELALSCETGSHGDPRPDGDKGKVYITHTVSSQGTSLPGGLDGQANSCTSSSSLRSSLWPWKSS